MPVAVSGLPGRSGHVRSGSSSLQSLPAATKSRPASPTAVAAEALVATHIMAGVTQGTGEGQDRMQMPEACTRDDQHPHPTCPLAWLLQEQCKRPTLLVDHPSQEEARFLSLDPPRGLRLSHQ